MATRNKKDELESPESDGGSIVMEPDATDNFTFTIALPAEVHQAPAHEAAVAIHDIAVSPDAVTDSTPATTTVTVVAADVAVHPEPEPAPHIPSLPEPDQVYSRRGRQRGEVSATPEPASMLTADRLIEQGRSRRKPAPEGFLQKLLYDATLHLVNVGDSLRVRQRKAIDARIGKHLDGEARFIPVLTRKGGVGKTTISALLGMAMADVREDRVIAIDANPDRGTLAERIPKSTRATVRDVVTRASTIRSFSEFQTLISRDDTRLDVLASDADPMVADAFDERDYEIVADLAARFYSVVITDCGTGIVHSVMKATLNRADSIVVVSGGSVDEARLASETLTWLESNGYAGLVKNAIVALNTATHGTNLVKLEEIEAHFRSRVREIVRVPYDPALATGSMIDFHELKPLTRESARELAALVVDGLPQQRDA